MLAFRIDFLKSLIQLLGRKQFNLLKQPLEIDLTSAGMQVERPLGKLGEFGKATSNGDGRQGMHTQIFQQATGKIAHIKQRGFRQVVERLGGAFRR